VRLGAAAEPFGDNPGQPGSVDEIERILFIREKLDSSAAGEIHQIEGVVYGQRFRVERRTYQIDRSAQPSDPPVLFVHKRIKLRRHEI